MDTTIVYALATAESALIELASAVRSNGTDSTLNKVESALARVKIVRTLKSYSSETQQERIDTLKTARAILNGNWDSRISAVCKAQINAAVRTIDEAL